MQIKTEIAGWDMKSVAAIIEIYERYASSAGFVDKIVDLMNEHALQRGATWLLKHHLEIDGNSLSPEQIDGVCGHLTKLEHWESKLHILQCASQLPVSKNCLPNVEMFLRQCLKSDVKFIRAWAYSGFHQLATQYPQFQQEAKLLLDQAILNETAGSIKVRIRHAIKHGF